MTLAVQPSGFTSGGPAERERLNSATNAHIASRKRMTRLALNIASSDALPSLRSNDDPGST